MNRDYHYKSPLKAALAKKKLPIETFTPKIGSLCNLTASGPKYSLNREEQRLGQTLLLKSKYSNREVRSAKNIMYNSDKFQLRAQPFFRAVAKPFEFSRQKQRKWVNKPQQKANFKQYYLQKPKLRQTNSTLCQSPKAKSSSHLSRANQFQRIRLLGKGKFGNVFLVKHLYTGFIAALKIIRKTDLYTSNQEETNKMLSQLVSQVKLQMFLDHPNLIKVYSFFSDDNNVYMLLELGCDGQLMDLLEKQKKFNEETTSIITREIVEGIHYVHKKAVIHRDIKLQNIVLIHGMAKICDFGWSAYCPKDMRSTLCGTPLYLSPQIMKGKLYHEKIDIWAIGALAHELYTSNNPFNIKTKKDLQKIVTQDFLMNVGSPQLRSFITFILRKDPSKRPNADTVKRHPFLKKYQDLQTSDQLCSLVYSYIK